MDPSPTAQALARELGANEVVGADAVATVQELTGGGAHVVLDFVGERGAEKDSVKMLRQGRSSKALDNNRDPSASDGALSRTCSRG